MHRRSFITAGLGLGLGSGAAWSTPSPEALLPSSWHRRSLVGLGTTLSLRVAHPEPHTAQQALDAAVRVLREIEHSMSLFRPDSEISRLNRSGELRQPSHHLLHVLGTAMQIARDSHGRFDPTVQPLWQAWDRAARERRMPDAAERTAARQRVGWQGLTLSDQRIAFSRPGMGLTLNGIAQGYAADAVTQTLRSFGIGHALLDTGESAAWGLNEHQQAWTLGLEDPHDTHRCIAALRLDGRAVATSAGHRSAFTPDHRHHHILDPHLGDSPQALSAVTVLAPSAMRADALTKVMFMAAPDRLPALAKRWGVGVVWVDKDGRLGHTQDVTLVNT